jgi:hypothetical protein
VIGKPSKTKYTKELMNQASDPFNGPVISFRIFWVSLDESRINDTTQQGNIYNRIVITKHLLIYNDCLKRCRNIVYNSPFNQTKQSRASGNRDDATVATSNNKAESRISSGSTRLHKTVDIKRNEEKQRQTCRKTHNEKP